MIFSSPRRRARRLRHGLGVSEDEIQRARCAVGGRLHLYVAELEWLKSRHGGAEGRHCGDCGEERGRRAAHGEGDHVTGGSKTKDGETNDGERAWRGQRSIIQYGPTRWHSL